MSYRVVCIDDTKQPSFLPKSSLVKKDEVYTVLETANMANQRMILGYKLVEVSFPPDCPYKYHKASRFRPYTEEDAEAERAVEELLQEELIEI